MRNTKQYFSIFHWLSLHFFLWSREDLQNLFFFTLETGLYFIKLIILNLVDAVWSQLCLFSVNKKLTKTVLWSIWANSVTNTSEDKYQANQITLTDNANTCKCSACIKLPMWYRVKNITHTKLISAQNLIMIKDSCTGYSDDHIWCLLVNVRWL